MPSSNRWRTFQSPAIFRSLNGREFLEVCGNFGIYYLRSISILKNTTMICFHWVHPLPDVDGKWHNHYRNRFVHIGDSIKHKPVEYQRKHRKKCIIRIGLNTVHLLSVGMMKHSRLSNSIMINFCIVQIRKLKHSCIGSWSFIWFSFRSSYLKKMIWQ